MKTRLTGGHAEDGAAEHVQEEEEASGADGCSRAPDALIAEENANAEYVIGLDASPEDCSISRLAAFRAKLQMVEEHGRTLSRAAHWQAQSNDSPEQQMDLAVDVAAHGADHRSACVDLRALAKTMGTKFQEEIETQVTATQRLTPRQPL